MGNSLQAFIKGAGSLSFSFECINAVTKVITIFTTFIICQQTSILTLFGDCGFQFYTYSNMSTNLVVVQYCFAYLWKINEKCSIVNRNDSMTSFSLVLTTDVIQTLLFQVLLSLIYQRQMKGFGRQRSIKCLD